MVDAETQLLRPSIDSTSPMNGHASNPGMLTIEPKEVSKRANLTQPLDLL